MTWTYDSNSRLTQARNATASTISHYDYTYDTAGRRVSCAKSGAAMSESRTDTYGYNVRSELISAAKTEGSPSPATEHEYAYDTIGNRQSSADLGESRTYTANNLNQYTGISDGVDTFVPQFDDDGQQKSAKPKPKAQGDRDFEATPQEWSEERYSATQRQLYQTLIQTKTGVWSVTYNGENRPVSWSCGETNVIMSFDRMGRRVEYTETVGNVTNAHHTFVYDGYLQIADNAGNRYVWDPTEPVATRPLVWIHNADTYSYTHDGNKNVSEVVDANGAVTAHYEYAPFGDVTVTVGSLASANRFRFSSEYADDALELVYYNYRHYEPVTGRWSARDPSERHELNQFNYVNNQPFRFIDRLGLSLVSWFREIFNRPKCEKAGGQYVGGNCCCKQQIFNPDKSCCISEEIHSKQGEAVAFVYKDYISDKLDGGFNERGVHYWLEWDGNRIEANPSNNGLGTVYYIPSAPLIINPDNFPVFYFDDPSTDGNKTSAKQPFRTEYLSKCDGYDVRKFKDCLHKHAKQDNGKSTKMLCYDYIDNLISICKQEQHNERAK